MCVWLKLSTVIFKALIAYPPKVIVMGVYTSLKPYIDCLGGQNWCFNEEKFLKVLTFIVKQNILQK